MRLIEIATERYLRHLVAATVFALVAMAALPLTAAASAEPAPLALAQTIRAELDARYRLVPGRPLAVTEASTTGVVESLTLFSADPLETRTVAADNGVYFAICPPRATCPFPARRLA